LQNLLYVAFLAVLFRGLISPRAHVLAKEFKFGSVSFLVQGSAVLGAIISVVLAWIMRNVWALVIGCVAEMAILCIFSFVFVPFRPRFTLHRDSLRDLLKYARGLVGLPILTVISIQAPILILGKVISDDLLGHYYYAALLAYIPIDLHTRIVGPVLLPAFSDRQDNEPALCRGLFKATRWTALFTVPLIVFMICCSAEILSLAYGSTYAVMSMPLALLCVHILARSELSVMSGLYLAIGRPDLQRRFTAVRTAIIVVLVYPAAVRFGAVGSAAGVLVSGLVTVFMQAVTLRSVINLRFGDYFRAYIPGVLLSLPVIAVIGLFRLFKVDSVIVIVAVGSLSLAATYVIYLGWELFKGRTFSNRN